MAFRPLRVGITQSNRSTPRRIASRMSRGVPTPIRYRGRSAGRTGQVASSDAVHLLGRLAHAQTADGVAGEIQLHATVRHSGRRKSSVQPALDDGEQGLVGTPRRLPAAGCPADRPLAGVPHDLGSLGSGTTWSSTMATSLPRASWISTARSGRQLQQPAVDMRAERRRPRR